jgi:hypothetical protein
LSPEDRFKNRVLRELREEFGGVWFTVPRTKYGRSGVSDVVGCYNGRFVALEFKAPNSSYKATPSQLKFLDDVEAERGLGMVIDSLEAVEALRGVLRT